VGGGGHRVGIWVPRMLRSIRHFIDEVERATGKASTARRRPVSDSSLTKEHHQESAVPPCSFLQGMFLGASKTGGARALDSRWDRALVSQKKVESASSLVTRFGGFALVFSRLVLGTRTALLVVSGLTRYPPSGSSGLITARTTELRKSS
jgi:hypothetical protein